MLQCIPMVPPKLQSSRIFLWCSKK